MKVWSAIYNFIAVFLIILIIPAYYNYSKHLDKDFDQARLDMAVDKATEAMMIEASSVGDLEMDYLNPDSIVLTPTNALDTFNTVMCFNYGMQPTVANKNMVQNSICAMVLCDEYGYYIAELVEDDTTPNNSVKGMEYTLRWSMRTPYVDTESRVGYTQTFSYTYYPLMEINNSNGATQLIKQTIDPSDNELRQKIRKLVNKQINNAIISEIDRRNSGSFPYKFYLPSDTTMAGVNPIDGPSVLVILNNAHYASIYNIDVANVGGYRVRPREYIVCFKKDGQNWYCYSNQLPLSEAGSVVEIVNTMKDACDKGYSPWMPYLMNKKYKD